MYEGSPEEIPKRIVGKISKVTDREAYEKKSWLVWKRMSGVIFEGIHEGI